MSNLAQTNEIFFDKNGLLYLSLDEAKTTTDQLIRAQPFLGTLAADPTLRGLAEALGFIPAGVKEGQISLKDFATPLINLSTAIDGNQEDIALSRIVAWEVECEVFAIR